MNGGKNMYVFNQYQNARAVIMLIMAMTLAGSSVVVGKMLANEIPVFFCSFASLLVAFLCMIPLMRGRLVELKELTFEQWLYLFLQELCGIVLFRVFILYGLKSTGAIQAGIATGTTPAILALLSLTLLGEKLTRRTALGIGLAVIGCLLINIFSKENSNDNNLFGCVLVLAAVVSEALFTIFRKRIADSVSAITNTTVLIFCSLVLLLPFALWDFTGMSSFPQTKEIVAILYYGVFATVLAYLLWTGFVGDVSGMTAGAVTAAMPASAVVLAALILGEEICFSHLLGCFFIVVGIWVTIKKNDA